MFRYEKPQKGRNREFYQIGVESFGDASAYKDAEVIKLAADILKNTGLKGTILNINTLNCSECGPEYIKALASYLEKNKSRLCETCVQKIERVPVRVLDCKVETCKETVAAAPKPAEYLCEKCKNHYSEVKKLLTGVKVNFIENPLLVRGLDYYTGVVFEFVTDKLGPQQNTVLAGGRYDRLVYDLGGKETPATGFAMGIERIVEVLSAEGSAAVEPGLDVFIVVDEKYISEAFVLLNTLRESSVKAGMSFEGKSFKSQFREADSHKAKCVIVIGENEKKNNTVMLKNMATGEQSEVKISEVTDKIKLLITND
jgi:histidyl-tRNA synthetase